MTFEKAFERLLEMEKIKLPEWDGYLSINSCSRTNIEIPVTFYNINNEHVCVMSYKKFKTLIARLGFIDRNDWEVVTESPNYGNFIEKLNIAKSTNCRIRRDSWGINEEVTYQKGYPEGIKCNKQTAEAWNIKEGDLFKCNPYLQKRNQDGTFSMYQPSVDDLLATDWIISNK